MRDKDQGSGLQVTTPRRAPGDPGAEVEEYIGPGFRSRGLYGEVNPASEDTAASRGDGGTEPTPSRGRFAGCGPRGYRRPDARIAEDTSAQRGIRIRRRYCAWKRKKPPAIFTQ
jgi:hypothetical protein